MSLRDDDTAAPFEGLAALAGTLVALDFRCDTFENSICDPSDTQRVAAALVRLSSLERLTFGWFGQKRVAGDVLAEALPALKQLTSLQISSSTPPRQPASWPLALMELSLSWSSWIFDVRAAPPQPDSAAKLGTPG